MVERPIKKSERQAKPDGESNESVAKALPTTLPTRNVDRPTLSKDRPKVAETDREKESDRSKGKGRGKGKGREEEPRQMVSPALARGPKPTKPKPPEPEVEEIPPEVTEAVIAEEATAEETPEAVAASESA